MTSLSSLRSALAAALSISLVLAAPGSRAYAEAARQAPIGRAGAPIAAPTVRLNSISLPSAQLGFGALRSADLKVSGAVVAGVSAQGVSAQAAIAAPNAAVPGLTAAQARQGSQRLSPHALSKQAPTRGPTALERLSVELPDLSRVSDSGAKSESGADFARRIGIEESSTKDGSLPLAGVSVSRDSGLAPATISESKASNSVPAAAAAKAPIASRAATLLAAGVGAFAFGFGAGQIEQIVIGFPIILASLILHEMGHAWAAYKLGDPTAKMMGRMSFKPRDLKTHIDPLWSIGLPLFTMLTAGMVIGGAVPVPFNPSNFKGKWRSSDAGGAVVAIAGPAVNVLLAGVAALAYVALSASGIGGLALAIAGTTAILNSGLAVFNMINPAFPFDGHHVVRWLLPAALSYKVDAWYRNNPGFMQIVPGLVIMYVFMKIGVFAAVAGALLALLAGGASSLVGLVASATVAGSLMVGQTRQAAPPLLNPDRPVPIEQLQDRAAEVVVILDGAPSVIPEDAHLSFAGTNIQLFTDTQQKMLAALEQAGLPAETLASYNATPVGTYRRINAATIRLDASKADAFAEALRAQGHRVFPNAERRIVVPVPVSPEDMDPANRNPITMEENTAIARADGVLALAAKKWGNPNGEGAIRGFFRRLLGGSQAPQTPVGVIDTGVDTAHPLLNKGVTAKNVVANDDGRDDNGHGTWVTSMVRNFARWNNKVTSYKAFVNGGATLDDILKALTSAANDGNIVISNSWGSDDGDPNSPDSELVRKLAEEGHIMVFAAGNAGPRANTIGSPAIVSYRTADGTPRVVSVAAAGRDKKIAYFSSTGPGSRKTKSDPSYPKRPDLTGLGYNTQGAWPTDARDADVVDPVKGPLKSISGTSMSTPEIAGVIVLLAMMFNVTTVGARLDAVVKAVMDTLEKTGQPRDKEGEGFINVEAAYKALEAALGPAPGARRLWGLLKRK